MFSFFKKKKEQLPVAPLTLEQKRLIGRADVEELKGFKKFDKVRHKSGGPVWIVISFSEVMNQAFAGRYTNDRLVVRRYDENGKEQQTEGHPEAFEKVSS